MAYLVLARKYRPQVFGEMSGQEHVVRTISNALRTGQLAHAFLATLPGGKTAPRIGEMGSTDNGLHWWDLGIIMEAPAGSMRLQSPVKLSSLRVRRTLG